MTILDGQSKAHLARAEQTSSLQQLNRIFKKILHLVSRLTSANGVKAWRLSVDRVKEMALALLASLAGTLIGLGQAIASGPYDDKPYDWNIGFDNPMSTIAGLTDWGKQINYVYGITTWVCAGIFLAVAIPVCIAIYKFRVGPDDDGLPPKQVHGNAFLEFTWTIIPCILLVLIAVPTWKVIFQQAEKPRPDALTVEVIGHQWWWEFRYPDYGVTTANELHLPEGRQIFFKITSADVIHSFWVPVMGGKVDALPGEIRPMLFTTPEYEDDQLAGGMYFQGHCAELCGSSHALMRFHLVLRTAGDFDAWLQEHDRAPVVATARQQNGEVLFNQCIACHAISGTMSAEIPGEKIGPNLSNFGARAYLGAGVRPNTPKHLAAWLRDPTMIKPGSLMPNLGLSEEDIDNLMAYLQQSTAKKY